MYHDDDLRLALALADIADAITMDRFRAADLRVDTKPDLTPVSEADSAVETALREYLARERPGDAIIGEEYGATGGPGRRWIIDPIDATKNYVRGIPVFATLIGLQDHAEVVVGVVSAPALARRWWAGRGTGAVCNGDSIGVSAVAKLEDAQLSINSIESFEPYGLGDRILEMSRRCWRTRGFGDFWSHMLVAEGAVDVAIEPIVSEWDLAPLQVIVEEAGGRFTDLAGMRRIDGGNVVTSNGVIHDEALRFFAR